MRQMAAAMVQQDRQQTEGNQNLLSGLQVKGAIKGNKSSYAV